MAAQPICSIGLCNNPSHRSGFCRAHYLRNYRHGDPLGGKFYLPLHSFTGICLAIGCEKSTKRSGGYCPMHAERLRKHGSLYEGAFRPRGICSVSGCEAAHFGNGYCLAHYKRFKKYGDPLAGGTKWGAARAFLDKAAQSTTGDCIAFPYCTTKDGYGRIRVCGETIGAHVYVATVVHGPKPTPKHEVCHKCGKGHEGCVNPSHLYWGTRSDNVRDAIAHGTFKCPPNRWAMTGKRIQNEKP